MECYAPSHFLNYLKERKWGMQKRLFDKKLIKKVRVERIAMMIPVAKHEKRKKQKKRKKRKKRQRKKSGPKRRSLKKIVATLAIVAHPIQRKSGYLQYIRRLHIRR